ncbi:Alkaline-phosphatase-like, core domain [Phytophthora cactorum]|nr:Alkaline-phosphatase-like, core domain [Phytophthora cactorum]
MMTPFIVDLVLVINREMRFTFDLVTMAISEKEFVGAAPISAKEIQRGCVATTLMVVASELGRPNELESNSLVTDFRTRSGTVTTKKGIKYVEVALEEGADTEVEASTKISRGKENRTYRNLIYQHALRVAVVIVALVVLPAAVVALRCVCSPLVAYVGMNATLNELFGHALQPTPSGATFTKMKGGKPWVEAFIHPTEEHELFGDGSLYRRTTGFRGDLAFDVDVSKDNPPNVLVIGVESFRFQDSRYLVGEEDPSNLFKGVNMTITPNFDRWAKRGVALRNLWSSTPTSRSLESLLFAQVPYDSTLRTGITGGRKKTKLSGLPQLFKAKGYDNFFTTGCLTRFENWNVFLPAHGYDVVLESKEMVLIAENRLGITHDQWFGDEQRGFKWGVHDDINLRLLGDMLVEKTKLQKADKPDFSALYEGEKNAKDIKNYLEMRHFTDLHLGKFMDRMEKEGILNDTIVVIVGDHGQAPEADVTNNHEESVTRVAGAIIAESRLGNAAGLVLQDAVEQYDILNTLADITGLPKGGFVQNGIGRSLKRKVRFGERVVFSNDPSRKMSIVRGHRRLRYDQVTASMMLHDTENDHAMTNDLFPGLSLKSRPNGSIGATTPHDVDADDIITNEASETKNTRRRRPSRELWGVADLPTRPWFGWLFVYTFVLFCFSTTRCLTLGALVEMYGSPQDYTTGFKTAALGLGLMEDFVCATYFACTLWAFDLLKRRVIEQSSTQEGGVATGVAGNAATFVVSWLLFVAVMAPFVADLMLVANRNMRFTFELVAAVLRERHHLNAAPISAEEIQRGYEAATVLVIVAAAFGFVRTSTSWSDLSSWNPTHLVAEYLGPRTRAVGGAKKKLVYYQIAVVFVGLVVFPAAVVALCSACSPLAAYSGLNATLNEMFGHALQPTPTYALLTGVKGDQPWVEMYIHPTEQHELFGNDTLYRRTTGFQGSLAFDVEVSIDNPPNVLVIGMSLSDSKTHAYLVGEEDPSNLFKGTNLTITPNFDKWAKRGVALRNIWSSNPTSRSLESLLFAQEDTKLAGLPQLFDAKGYETFFTTGSSITLDNWNLFLPTHGYKEVWEAKAMLTLGEKHLKIRRHQWFGPEHYAFNWGVHDDLSFRLLGDLLRQKTKKQKQRVAKGEPKNHCFSRTIPSRVMDPSKHDQRHERAADIQNYLEMRYFTDMELGKFMDRMEKEGILNDTIESVTRVAGTIIAEGRLGNYAGAVIDDAAEQYDILNTLADITGLPEGGFVQNGVGRSLKRKANMESTQSSATTRTAKWLLCAVISVYATIVSRTRCCCTTPRETTP